ncbi:MAG TPA: GTP-binding protein, partial [Streptosporangiaceae bacterium]|nr:GTP-binding protein [Streptosporangiaceae bacterium]
MSERTLNLGILAHVDAGKTSLTERLLYAAGVIDEIGSVDDGTTQTDTLALERQRGITIKSAVTSFRIGDRAVNLIDTPGHPDFIAEVERVLSVLDGAVLVISAVEGVQAQTHILMRALRRMRIPTLIFVNKIDRTGARSERVLAQIADQLTAAAIPLGTVEHEGTKRASTRSAEPDASVLGEQDDAILAAYVTDAAISPKTLRRALRQQTRTAAVYPVLFGSAMTGAGIASLIEAIPVLLPSSADGTGPATGTVFKMERGPAGEKIAYLRMFSGTLSVRERLDLGKVTGIAVFDRGATAPRARVTGGQIAKVWGLTGAKVDDSIGSPARSRHRFAPPALEAIVESPVAESPGARGALHAALSLLAEQDSLINVRQDKNGDIRVSLYGDVQKEVLQATLVDEFGLQVRFRDTQVRCIERPAGTGAAVQRIKQDGNLFLATIGLRVDPAPPDSGVAFRLEIERGALPLAFIKAIEDTARRTLADTTVTDCVVTLTESGYCPRQSHAH